MVPFQQIDQENNKDILVFSRKIDGFSIKVTWAFVQQRYEKYFSQSNPAIYLAGTSVYRTWKSQQTRQKEKFKCMRHNWSEFLIL